MTSSACQEPLDTSNTVHVYSLYKKHFYDWTRSQLRYGWHGHSWRLSRGSVELDFGARVFFFEFSQLLGLRLEITDKKFAPQLLFRSMRDHFIVVFGFTILFAFCLHWRSQIDLRCQHDEAVFWEGTVTLVTTPWYDASLSRKLLFISLSMECYKKWSLIGVTSTYLDSFRFLLN